jgi:tetratricopeptide (TPR) repeat protein
MSSVPSVGHYQLGERCGSSVWRGVDTNTGKPVALKVLTKQLPKDTAKRDAMVREIRVAAALYHAFIVPILEVAAVGDNLLLVMESLDVQCVSRVAANVPMARPDALKYAYQLADALRFLHSKGLVHGNVNTDSVMITSTGHVRLGGLNLLNMIPRPEGPAAAYKQKSADARSVAYMAPEQIMPMAGNIDARADIFSFGVILYEMSTGRLPYQATTANDFARAIVEGQPLSPKAANPQIDTATLNILGHSLFKDPFKRYDNAKLLLDDIGRADPEALKTATDLSTRPVLATSSAANTRDAILFVADVANYKKLQATDQAAATSAAARMQQLLGEAVYLFDGQVIDPFGSVLIAELPSIESALEAARKGEFDFSPDQQGDDPIAVRLMLHAAGVTTKDGAVVGDGVTKALAALDHLPPSKLFLSEEFIKRARGIRVRDAGARGGLKFYTLQPDTEAVAQQEAAPANVDVVGPADEVHETKAPSRRSRALLGAAAALAILLAAGAFFVVRSRTAAPRGVAAPVSAATAEKVDRRVLIVPFTVDGGDPTLVKRANAIRVAAMEILRTLPGVELADTPSADVLSYAATLRIGAAGPEMLPAPNGVPAAAAVALPDAASGIRPVVEWIASQTGAQLRGVSSSPEALNAFATAASAGASDSTAGDAIRTAVTADPNFLAAQMLAMRYYAGIGKSREAITAANQVVTLNPSDLDAARMLARLTLANGEVQPAFAAYNTILRKETGDVEALTQVARYAASAGDTARFSNALTRLKSAPPAIVAVHAPDLLVASGKYDQAVSQYYDIEANVPQNAALSLKIGRLSVLRRSMPIAELELKKLEQADPMYGHHLLKAYMAAQRGVLAEAEAELKLAGAASTPGDDYWTSAAEIYAMGGDPEKTLNALDKAIARKEPTATYILSNRLFGFLASEPRFLAIRSTLSAQQEEIRSALAQIKL